jgi:hypothetical protein
MMKIVGDLIQRVLVDLLVTCDCCIIAKNGYASLITHVGQEIQRPICLLFAEGFLVTDSDFRILHSFGSGRSSCR